MAESTVTEKTPAPRLSEEELRAGLAEAPANPHLNYQLMKLLVEQGRTSEALLPALKALESKKSGRKVYVDVLQLLTTMKLPRLVTVLGSEALRNGIDHPRVYAAVARGQAATKNLDGANATLDSAQQTNADSQILQRTRARLEKRRQTK